MTFGPSSATNLNSITTKYESSMVGVARMVAEWLSLDERLIFQSVSQDISLHLREELERGIVGLSKMIIGHLF